MFLKIFVAGKYFMLTAWMSYNHIESCVCLFLFLTIELTINDAYRVTYLNVRK